MNKGILFVVFIVLFASCNSNEGRKPMQNWVIGFSQCTMIDEWRKTMIDEMEREISFFRDYNIEFIVKNANDNNDTQINDVNDLIDQGIDLLIISPNEAEQLTPTVESVFNKGIPVIVIDRKINSPNYSAFIGADNLEVGREAGYYAVELLKGEGKILEITGLKGSTPAIERSKGFNEIISKYPGIVLSKRIEGAWLEEKTLNITDSLFRSYKDFNLIFAHNDFMANAASKSAIKHNIKSFIIGVDGLNTLTGGVSMVLNGMIDGTVLYPTGGDKAIQLAVDILSGKDFQKNIILNTYRIDETNARTLWLQGQQLSDQQFKLDKQGEQLNYMSKILNKRKILLLMTYSTIILLIFTMLIIYFSWRNKNKMNKVLDEKNRTINMQNKIITKQRDDSVNLFIVAEEAKENKLRLFTDLSHEFRTVVTLITNPITDILGNTNDETIKTKLKVLQRGAERLTRLTDGILKFRSIDENNFHPTFFNANISQFITNVCEAFHEQAVRKKIDLKYEITPDIYAEFDLAVIEKVMYNLLSNAIKFTHANGSVTVKMMNQESKIIIMVQDTGIGIPENELPFLFRRFYKVNKPQQSSDNEQIGIGLALSKELIQLHGGNLSVESIEKQGSCFSFSIPQFHGITTGEDNRLPIDFNSIAERNKDGKVILIVEDNPDLLSVLCDIIGKYYTVIRAQNGEQGLNLALSEVPDLILSDILMPIMDGMQMCIEIKKHAATCHIPVILLTAIDTNEYTIKGFDMGADAYITKPFNEFILLSNIKNLISSREKLKEYYCPSPLLRELLHSKQSANGDFLKECINNIYKNLENENYTLDNLCEIMNMSRSSMYRKIRETTSLKPVDFIKKAKLNYAAKLLLTKKNYNINEVSWRSGFSDSKYFSKCFIQEFGINPSHYSESFHSEPQNSNLSEIDQDPIHL